MGGGELARDFLKDDLVDELYIGIVPVLIGEGIPLFPSGFPQREFTLLETLNFFFGWYWNLRQLVTRLEQAGLAAGGVAGGGFFFPGSGGAAPGGAGNHADLQCVRLV